MQHLTLQKSMMNKKFQSMHPIKDATKFSPQMLHKSNISIHAPYKGCNMQISLHAIPN